MISSRVIVPVSGGLDSTVILHWVINQGHDVHAVSFNYGQRHFDQEMRFALINCKSKSIPHKIINLDFFKDIVKTSSLVNNSIDVAKTKDILGDPQTVNYVPNRNMMMLSICTAYAESIGAVKVYHGSALVDSQAGYWDGSIEFVRAINKVNELNRRDRVEISAPLILKSKKDIIDLGVSLGVDFSKTWTCYEGKKLACGQCPACSSRIKGFIDSGFIDPVKYSVVIPWDEYGCVAIN